MKKCNRLSLDTTGLMNDLKAAAMDAMQAEGEILMDAMRQEVHMTTDGGAPGKPEWRDHIAQNIRHVSTTVAGGGIEMEFGYSPTSESDEVRAMVVAYGSGDKAEGGGARIHAGPPGRQVWDGDLSGRKASTAKSEYDLPEAFNQRGNMFVSNAIKRMRARFGDHLEATFATLPSATFYRKVSVKRQ